VNLLKNVEMTVEYNEYLDYLDTIQVVILLVKLANILTYGISLRSIIKINY
jgi:hypothetical protein